MANTAQIMPDIYERLRELLAHLPDTLPEWPKRDFRQFVPSAEEIKFYESTADAANHALGSRMDDRLIDLRGRGPKLVAVTDVLIQYAKYDPSRAPLFEKWAIECSHQGRCSDGEGVNRRWPGID
jgi:hypothetical protein